MKYYEGEKDKTKVSRMEMPRDSDWHLSLDALEEGEGPFSKYKQNVKSKSCCVYLCLFGSLFVFAFISQEAVVRQINGPMDGSAIL